MTLGPGIKLLEICQAILLKEKKLENIFSQRKDIAAIYVEVQKTYKLTIEYRFTKVLWKKFLSIL